MEKIAVMLIPALLTVTLFRLVMLPMKLLFKFAIHAGCGFVCLWLLNSISGFTGIFFPVNGVTVCIAGFLGVPVIGLMALLEMLG